MVEYAYDLWLQYDVRSDDITILLIKFVDVPEGEHRSIVPEEWPRTQSTFNIMNSAPIHPSKTVLNDSRPVRRTMTYRCAVWFIGMPCGCVELKNAFGVVGGVTFFWLLVACSIPSGK